jgi:hypothetical protein
MSFQTSALILSWIAILLLALVVSGLVRQVHALSRAVVIRRPESVGLPPGTPAPGFVALAPVPPATLVLLFLEPDCGTCTEMLEEAVAQTDRDGFALRALYRGEIPPHLAGRPVRALGGQAELFERYDAVATPFATVVDRTGRVLRSGPAGSPAALRHLLGHISSPATVHSNHLGGTS